MRFNVIQANWLAWSIQILILSAVGWLTPRLLRITDPTSRLLGAQFTLLLCLILPFATPRVGSQGRVGITAAADLSGPIPGRRIPARRPNPWSLAIPGLMAAGALI